MKKAAVDAAFRECLLHERDRAAARIGLVLEPAEAALLRAIPVAQLAAVVANTTVPPRFRAAFMGYAAAAMLAAMGLSAEGCAHGSAAAGGARADDPPPGTGSGYVSTTATANTAGPTAATASINIDLDTGYGESHTGAAAGKGGMRPDNPEGDEK